jgi:hypothetical protein
MRSRVEWLLSALSLVALLVLGARALQPASRPESVRVRGDAIGTALRDWTVRPRAASLHVDFTAAPQPHVRDWLRAIAAAGTPVSWSGSVPDAAIEAEWETGPAGAALVRVAGASQSHIIVGDAIGAMDSAQTDDVGAQFRLPAAQGALWVRMNGEALRRLPQHESARRVVILGPADWEPRFVAAALEKAGWQVDARFRVGPSSWVTQGRPLPLDTARHGVVIVFGAPGTDIARGLADFVQNGGGLVLAAGASGLDALAPGRSGAAVRPIAGLSVPAARDQLEYRPIVRMLPDASPLERAHGGVRVAARRLGAGRVVMLGDAETWRLAMASDAGRAQHARLWNSAVSLVSPRAPAFPASGDDVAPRAALVEALGLPRDVAPASGRTIPWEAIAGVLLFVSLVAEWAVRRMRGLA